MLSMSSLLILFFITLIMAALSGLIVLIPQFQLNT